MDEFSIQHERKGNVTVVNISGRVDSDTAPTMDAELTKLISTAKKLVIDLKDVTFLSSAGVRAIIKALKSAKKSRGQVRLASIPDHIDEILQTLGIMELVHEYPTVEEAVASF